MLQLKKLLLGPDGTVSRVASSAISNILSCTREGADWLTPQPGLQELFAPFQRPVALKKETHKIRVDVQKVRQIVDLPAVWGGTDLHGPWLTKLVQTLIDCFAKNTSMRLLAGVCNCSLEVCRVLLPFLIHELLLVDCSDVRIIVSKKMNDFFRAHFEEVAKCSSSLSTCSISPHLRPQSVGALLDVVIHLRQQAMPPRLATRGQNCWESNFWLADINYLHCARAALSCGRPTDAILLASIWCFQKERESGKAQMSSESLLERLDGEVQQVLYKASTMLGDTDSAQGTGLNLDPEGLGLLLPICDAQAATGGSEARQGLVGALYGSGLHHTLSKFLGSRPSSSEERQVQEECAWRLQQWDTFSPETARCVLPRVRNSPFTVYFAGNLCLDVFLGPLHQVGISMQSSTGGTWVKKLSGPAYKETSLSPLLPSIPFLHNSVSLVNLVSLLRQVGKHKLTDFFQEMRREQAVSGGWSQC